MSVPADHADPASPSTQAAAREDCLILVGDQGLADLDSLRDALRGLERQPAPQIDFTQVGRLDTAAALVIDEWCRSQKAAGDSYQLTGLHPTHQRVLALVGDCLPLAPDPVPRRPTLTDRLERIGRRTADMFRNLADLAGYLGLFLSRLWQAILHPRQFRLTSLIAQADAAGFQAVPIVILISFLIGVVIGYQGASQLQQFGAEIFAVDLIAISILRELGILLTAIIVAGRTASAYTAALGSMKMQQEIDAMQTLGIDPVQALVVPRVLALILTLPILALISDVSGLVGGAVMSWISLGISPAMFLTRLSQEVSINHVLVGLSKAPVFALLIGVIGCQAGMKVGSDAASLGAQTSRAVVSAIFAVIVADAAFSIFFSQMGW